MQATGLARAPAHDPRLRPLDVRPEPDTADDRVEAMGAQIVGELRLVDTVGPSDGLLQYLHPSIRKRWYVITERVDLLGRCLGLVLLQEGFSLVRRKPRPRQPGIEIDDAMQVEITQFLTSRNMDARCRDRLANIQLLPDFGKPITRKLGIARRNGRFTRPTRCT